MASTDTPSNEKNYNLIIVSSLNLILTDQILSCLLSSTNFSYHKLPHIKKEISFYNGTMSRISRLSLHRFYKAFRKRNITPHVVPYTTVMALPSLRYHRGAIVAPRDRSSIPPHPDQTISQSPVTSLYVYARTE